jgi:N-formylmaleamate deformylase
MKRAFRIAPLVLLAACAVGQKFPFSVSVTGVGRPMILIPGLESPGAVWDGTVAHYRTGYQLHVLTLSGFAGEPVVAGLRLSDVRDGVISYIRENKLDHPVIVGHSLGGFLALWIAACAPDRTGPIVTLDGVPFLPALFNPSASAAEGREDAGRMQKMYASLGPQQMEATARMALTQMISEPKNIEMAAAWAAKSDSAFVGQAVYDLMTTDLRPELGRIRTPVLLIGAGKTFGSKAQVTYEAQIANVPEHRVAIADALHFIMFDDPAFLFSVMDRFLAEGETHAK